LAGIVTEWTHFNVDKHQSLTGNDGDWDAGSNCRRPPFAWQASVFHRRETARRSFNEEVTQTRTELAEGLESFGVSLLLSVMRRHFQGRPEDGAIGNWTEAPTPGPSPSSQFQFASELPPNFLLPGLLLPMKCFMNAVFPNANRLDQ
jgi:hypothetical protein